MIWRDKFNTYSELIIICYVPLSISNNFWREIKNRIFFFHGEKYIWNESFGWTLQINSDTSDSFYLLKPILHRLRTMIWFLTFVFWKLHESNLRICVAVIDIPLAEKDLRQKVDRWTLINHRKEILLEDMENRELNRYFLNLKILKAWNLFPSKSSLDHKEIEMLATRWII